MNYSTGMLHGIFTGIVLVGVWRHFSDPQWVLLLPAAVVVSMLTLMFVDMF